MKKLLSIFLVLSMMLSLCTPALAVDVDKEQNEGSDIYSISTSSSGRIEVIYTNRDEKDKADTARIIEESKDDFEIRQYENEKLIQTVRGRAGGDRIIVTNYENGEITNSDTILVAERIEVQDAQNETVASTRAAAGYGSLIGTITFNQSVSGVQEEVMRVYSKTTKTDREAYTINGKATDTLSVIAGLIFSVIGVFLPAQKIATQIAIAIVTGIGGSVAGGAIGKVFSEDVSVDATHYTMTGYHVATARYSYAYTGTANHVQTKNSAYYNKWFYEGFTPQNWKENDNLAVCLWEEMISGIWPGVKRYS